LLALSVETVGFDSAFITKIKRIVNINIGCFIIIHNGFFKIILKHIHNDVKKYQ